MKLFLKQACDTRLQDDADRAKVVYEVCLEAEEPKFECKVVCFYVYDDRLDEIESMTPRHTTRHFPKTYDQSFEELRRDSLEMARLRMASLCANWGLEGVDRQPD